MIPPTGGPRDSLPPILVKATPPDSSRVFNSKTITFTFDEFIEQPQELSKNLIISPTPAIMPLVEAKLRTLTVRIKDTLEPNTTYYYNFGKAIVDVNEKNILNDFSYIFTTGNIIDTMQLSGKVVLAETGGIDTTLMVMLHRSGDDSSIIKERPRYITKLDGKGYFHFLYLAPGIYYIYSLQDENRTGRYFSSENLFAFADSAVEVKPDATPVILYAYADKKIQQGNIVSFGGGNKGPGVKPDDKKLKFTTSLNANVQDLLGNFRINFELPVQLIDTTKIRLSTDSSFNPLPALWELDSLKRKLTLNIKWKESTLYNLILDKEFAEDSLGRKLLITDTIRFTTKKQSDYGSLRISLANLDLSKNPVLQFSQGGRIINSFPVISTEFFQPLFFPGEYDLSILYDDNKNGVWDPGSFFGAKKQPELVTPLTKKIIIRPDWQNEYEISL